jgi:hypothetical protein
VLLVNFTYAEQIGGLRATQYFIFDADEDEEGTISDDRLQRNLVQLQIEYEQNIKSGKWHKFVNGE